jgi:putative membrane protein
MMKRRQQFTATFNRGAALVLAKAAVLLLALQASCTTPPRDSVALATLAGEAADDRPALLQSEAAFVIEQVDDLMFAIARDRIARDRATTEALRTQADRTLRDHRIMMDALRRIADRRNLPVPELMTDPNAEALATLSRKTGEDFNRSYLHIAYSDHFSDVASFAAASRFSDLELKDFAARFLPTVERHLAATKRLRDHHSS